MFRATHKNHKFGVHHSLEKQIHDIKQKKKCDEKCKSDKPLKKESEKSKSNSV